MAPALLTAVLAELHIDRVGLLVGCDPRVAAWYTTYGAQPIDPGQLALLARLP